MTDLYPWLVAAHVVGLVVFAVSHGVSMFVAFRVRGDVDPGTVAILLDLSKRAVMVAYLGLLLLLVGGVGAAWIANLWLEPWLLGSVGVLIVVLGVMYALASPYYIGIREALAELGPAGRPAIEAADLARRLDTRRPEILVLVGGTGMVVLVWLMVVKPG